MENWKFCHAYQKGLEMLFWTNFSRRRVKLHRRNLFGDQQGEKKDFLLSIYIYFSSSSLWRRILLFIGSATVSITILLTSWDFICLWEVDGSSMTLISVRTPSTAYQHTGKAQFNTVQDTFSPEYEDYFDNSHVDRIITMKEWGLWQRPRKRLEGQRGHGEVYWSSVTEFLSIYKNISLKSADFEVKERINK